MIDKVVMNLERFPFPDKTTCMEELQRDFYYKKIPSYDRSKIIDAAWERGKDAAYKYFYHTEQTIYDALKSAGITILRKEEDRVIGTTRYFAEFFEKTKKIILYTKSIDLWCEYNELSRQDGEEMILTHEFFHYLECKELSPVNEIYKVPALKIGRHIIRTSSLRSVSEIGAHSFTHTYYKLVKQLF